MKLNERLVVVVSPDQKSYQYWVEPRLDSRVPYHAVAESAKTATAATIATSLQNELPTLNT